MTKRSAVLLVFVLTLAPAAFAQGAPPPPLPPSMPSSMGTFSRELTIVSGTAKVAMTPDVASFTVGVESEGTDVRDTVARNAAIAAKVIAALKTRGVEARELRTSDFQLEPQERRNNKSGGYRVVNEISVTRKGVKDVADLISAAIEAGANQVRGPEFSVANEKAVQDQCIDLAFADARRKARRLADLSERKLGKVLAVTDGSSSPFELVYHSPDVEGGVLGGLAMETGVHTVDCGVTVAFVLE